MYKVLVEDSDWFCTEVYVDENYDNKDDAEGRFNEIKAEMMNGEWRSGVELWLFDSDSSVDCHICRGL